MTIGDTLKESIKLASGGTLDLDACILNLISDSEVDLSEPLCDRDARVLVGGLRRYVIQEYPDDMGLISIQFARPQPVVGREVSVQQFVRTFGCDLLIGAEDSWLNSEDLRDLTSWMFSLLLQLRYASDYLEFAGLHPSMIGFFAATTVLGLDDHRCLCGYLQQIVREFG